MLLKIIRFKNISDKRKLLLFLILLGVINIIQSIYTQLAHDEAYYWLWAKHLDWGFYEHPPMVAVFIKISGWFFSSELGVRFTTVVSSVFALYWVYIKLIQKDLWLYLAIVSSMFIVHVGGFLTAPDSPLFLFTTLFFIVFKEYLDKDSARNSFFLALSITAMMYSKYHAILVISIAFLSNFHLLKRKSFWCITIASLLLYAPHFWWLIQHGETGLSYALSDRFQENFQIKYIGSYFLGQTIVFGPILGIVFIYAAIKRKPFNPFEKTLKNLILFMFGFFFLWSFKGDIQANWTATLFIPITLLAHQFITLKPNLRKIIFRLTFPSLLIIFIVRLHLMFDFLPLTRKQNRANEFFGWKEYAETVDKLAQGNPVFVKGYQNASKLWFYRGKKTLALNSSPRINQFFMWSKYYEELKDHRALCIQDWLLSKDGEINNRGVSIPYKWIDEYRNYREAKLEISNLLPKTLNSKEIIPVELYVQSPPNECLAAKNESKNPPYLAYHITQAKTGKMIKWLQGRKFFNYSVCDSTVQNFNVKAPVEIGRYIITFYVVTENIIIWHSECKHFFEVVATKNSSHESKNF